MNIEQIRLDRARGIMVSPGTWDKLIETALVMKKFIALDAERLGENSQASLLLKDIEQA